MATTAVSDFLAYTDNKSPMKAIKSKQAAMLLCHMSPTVHRHGSHGSILLPFHMCSEWKV
jgi:hypothetical protein